MTRRNHPQTCEALPETGGRPTHCRAARGRPVPGTAVLPSIGRRVCAVVAMLALLAGSWALAPVAWAQDGAGAAGESAASDGSDDGAASESEGARGYDADPAVKPGGEGGTSFEAAPLSNQETPHYTLMIVAYLAMWLLLLGYAFVLFRRQRSIDGDLAELRDRIATLDDIVDDELEP